MKALEGEGSRSDLEAERDFLLASLADLEAERESGEMDDAGYQVLHDDYTARTAKILRSLAEAGHDQAGRDRAGRDRAGRDRAGRAAVAPAIGRSRPGAGRVRQESVGGKGSELTDELTDEFTDEFTDEGADAEDSDVGLRAGSAARGRSRRRLVGGLVALAVIGGPVGAVLTLATQRGAGDSLTGTLPASPAVEGAASGGQLGEALALERQGDAVGALKLYDQMLAVDPANAEALAYRGWLLKRAGLGDRALESLDAAIAADPAFADPHFFRGMLLFQDREDPAGAVVSFRRYLDLGPAPGMGEMVENVLRRAEQAAAGAPAASDPNQPESARAPAGPGSGPG
ncbi:MAG: tetratricopeptide repeat protein [Acidimicrobiales bacterium]